MQGILPERVCTEDCIAFSHLDKYVHSMTVLEAALHVPRHPIKVTLHPPQDNFSWVPNCSLGPPGWETKVSSKNFWFGLCEIAWFLGQPIANLRRGVCL